MDLYFQAKQAVRLQISVRVKWSKNRVQDQVYSKDLGNLFYSGIFRPRGCQDGSVCLVVKREEPQTMCILVSRVDSLSWLLRVIILLPKGWNVTALATVWVILNVVQQGGCYFLKITQSVKKTIFTRLLFIRSGRCIITENHDYRILIWELLTLQKK